MENSGEPSSSISFTSPSYLSNGSINNNKSYSETTGGFNLDIISLNKLSCNLEQLLSDSITDFSDADIVVENTKVGVHRCILAARSKFFHDHFKKDVSTFGKNGKPRYLMKDLLPYGKVGYEAFLVFLSYLYTGKLRPSPLEVSTCVDNLCPHDACRPAIDFAVELMYASTIFQLSEMVSLFQRRLLNLVGKAIVDDVIPILTVAFDCHLSHLLTQCVQRVAESDLDMISIEKQIPPEVAENIILLRRNSPELEETKTEPVDPLQEKRIKRIHKALDSHDVELVRLLLTESDITLDEAYALHYAVAYCDPKIVSELLSLDLADVNLKNTRGNTVLHVASRRKEPSIIVSLLNKGACASEPTLDGQTSLIICKRLTRPKDHQMKREQGQEANKDRLCIDVLEREMIRNPIAADVPISSLAMTDDLRMKLLYLEDRVAFARMFFPTEAKLVMEIAHVETTSGLAGLLSSRGSSGILMDVDLNETPISQNRKLLSKIDTLSRTASVSDILNFLSMNAVIVELGRHYFPHCSQVLDKLMEDDLPDMFYHETSPEERRMKRMRFLELKDEVQRAFTKDKEQHHRSGFSSFSSSSMKDPISHKVRKVL